jgi:DNA modification methylase/superfamily II DNA or RNA helicase
MEYNEFLKNKDIIDISSGFEAKDINPKLYDFQYSIVKWACKRGRAAIFADCGLGKTPMQLEWANQVHKYTGQPVLILAPLAVSKQTQREGDKFNIKVNICESHDDVINGINITNYEKLHKFDAGSFAGIVLDESSILKSYTGKFRTFIIESFQKTPYKLACTATPAPNDFMELGNHSEFLNVLSRAEMLSLFFINDTANVGTWRLKGHGEDKFWKWLCSWAVMLSKPSELGFDDSGFILPELNIIEHVIEFGKPLEGCLFPQKAETLNERRQARRESISEKIDLIKQIVTDDESWLIWCDLNNESESISKAIGAIEITGSQENNEKEYRMLGFSSGKYRVICTKPKLGGFGMNWQHCHNIIFAGLSDSYEAFYQAIRRCWRFGQKSKVDCHIITTDIEGNIVENIKRKEADAQRMRREMIKHMQDITKQELHEKSVSSFDYRTDVYKNKRYELHLGDNIDLIKELKDDSIGFSIFSPPFASLFTYTNSIRDMGNCRDKEDFLNHFKFLVSELHRVMMPGRSIAIHCMNLPMTITHDGVMGIHDFRGDIIRLFQDEKFIFHSEICIWKDPLVQAVRTKVLSLAHKQVCKDSSRCGTGIPDYIVVMRKQGDNPVPIERKHGFTEYIGEREFLNTNFHEDQRKNKLSHEIWQRYASPVWFDIRQTRVLSTDIARDEKDEKHVCPLQLDTIERCLELWSAKGDKVIDPFSGIGSTVYCAVKMGRYGIGFELKESYWKQSIKNLEHLELEENQGDLLSLCN